MTEDEAYDLIYGDRERRSAGILSITPVGEPPEGDALLKVERQIDPEYAATMREGE